ncbi:MAG: S-layer homology domain-containing protein [Chloroflexia bacterium]
MDAVASNDVWAIGEAKVEHWDGTQWHSVSIPAIPFGAALIAISASSATDVWVQGIYHDGQRPGNFVLHWNGTSWSYEVIPPYLPYGSEMHDVVALSSSDVWLAGKYSPGSGTRAAFSRYTDPCIPQPSTATPTNTPTATNTPTPVVMPYCWASVAPPDPGYDNVILHDVDAINGNDIWAVGTYSSGPPHSITVALHWDGSQWSVVPMPTLAFEYSIYALDARAPDDIWMVGAANYEGFFLNWNGSQWINRTPSGNAGFYVRDVVAIARNNAWAIGFAYGTKYPSLVIWHWNGTQWSGSGGWLCYWTCGPGAIEDIAPNDIWAIGHIQNTSRHGVIKRWDGTQWNSMLDAVIDNAGALTAIAGTSSNDVWIAADAGLLHWDGTAWTTHSRFGIGIDEMTAIAPNDVWAVGNNGILHWDGVQWGRVENAPGQTNLSGITAISSTNLWAVGASYDPNNHGMLLAHYSVSCQSTTPVPTRTPTHTPTPTGTPTTTYTPTATNTALPPRCPTERFTDVCPTDYFYQHVLDLNDLGILSGYNTAPPCDGPAHIPCFKPYNLTTRGQVSKIISLSAGFNEPVTEQTFQDVPPTHTFYQYIERMASRGIIVGYPCGGDNEPCISPDVRPYFRPGVMVSRAQLSKMTALSFGFHDPASGQTFEDVVPDNHFYPFIENLAARNIINGYPCGGPGEPCVPPANRPYFRYANLITRGQVAKILNLARLQSAPTPTPTVTPEATAAPARNARQP